MFCNGSLYKSFVQEGEFLPVLMPGIYTVKYFAMVGSARVLCRGESSGMCSSDTRHLHGEVFLKGFTLQEFCAGGRVLACADAWHLHGGSIR
jgi:hypothetical protein